MGRSSVVRTPCEGRTVAIVGDVYRFLATDEDGRYHPATCACSVHH